MAELSPARLKVIIVALSAFLSVGFVGILVYVVFNDDRPSKAPVPPALPTLQNTSIQIVSAAGMATQPFGHDVAAGMGRRKGHGKGHGHGVGIGKGTRAKGKLKKALAQAEVSLPSQSPPPPPPAPPPPPKERKGRGKRAKSLAGNVAPLAKGAGAKGAGAKGAGAKGAGAKGKGKVRGGLSRAKKDLQASEQAPAESPKRS